jgi:hypothetical protein
VTDTPARGMRPLGVPALNERDYRQFFEAERDASELRAAARAARETLAESSLPYRRFSDLLDELLPADRTAQDRIARAVSLAASELDALRRSRLDPLAIPPYPLFCLAEAFGIELPQLRRLIQGDHERFAAASASARGAASDAEGDPWASFDRTWDRITAENPARFNLLPEK